MSAAQNFGGLLVSTFTSNEPLSPLTQISSSFHLLPILAMVSVVGKRSLSDVLLSLVALYSKLSPPTLGSLLRLDVSVSTSLASH